MHEVFISYSSKDAATANAVCHILEETGIRCFIAPRDIEPGDLWAEALVTAIRQSRVFVLVFSGNSNRSTQVQKEIGIAVDAALTIIPLITSRDKPNGALEYYLADTHWIDALTPPLEQHIHHLAVRISALLEIHKQEDGESPSGTKPAEQAAGGGEGKQAFCLHCGYRHDLRYCPICGTTRTDLQKRTKRFKRYRVLSFGIWAILTVFSGLICAASLAATNYWQNYVIWGLAMAAMLALCFFAGTFIFRYILVRKRARKFGDRLSGMVLQKNLALYRCALITGSILVVLYAASITFLLLYTF